MTECHSQTTPISPSKPYPRLWASGLGSGDGMGNVGVVQDWVDGCDKLFAGEEVDADTFDSEDVQPLQKFTTPELPSRAIIEEHRIDHWPYRSWCEECCEGHGRERGHGNVDHKIAMISIDYAFMTKKGPVVDQGEEGWDDPECLKILVVKDSKSGSVFAHGIFRKGIDEKRFAVDMVVRDVLYFGYPQVLLKSDNEPAIVKLLEEALGALKASGLQAGEEHPPPYDSQANGAVESAVKQVTQRLRVRDLEVENPDSLCWTSESGFQVKIRIPSCGTQESGFWVSKPEIRIPSLLNFQIRIPHSDPDVLMWCQVTNVASCQ